MNQNQQEAVKLIAESREAVLATLENGEPFTSAVNYFYLPQEKKGKILILISGLARHAKNLSKNKNVSLQVLEIASVPLYQRKRVSVQGNLTEVTDPKQFESYKARYLEIFPESQIFFTLSDFHFYELEISELYYIGGFGKIESIR